MAATGVFAVLLTLMAARRYYREIAAIRNRCAPLLLEDDEFRKAVIRQ